MQVFLMAASIVSGTVGLLVSDTPPSLAHTLGAVMLVVWQLSLAVSGMLGCIAAVMARKDGLWSLLLERLALFMVAPLSIVYGVVIVSAGGWGAVNAASITCGYGFACVARYVQVERTLSWVRSSRTVS